MSETNDIQKVELKVTGMNCGHCQRSVETAIAEVAGVAKVTVDLGAGRATITGQGLDPAPMIERIAGLGFDAELIAE